MLASGHSWRAGHSVGETFLATFLACYTAHWRQSRTIRGGPYTIMYGSWRGEHRRNFVRAVYYKLLRTTSEYHVTKNCIPTL